MALTAGVLALARFLLIAWGLILAGYGAWDLLKPRGRLVDSSPKPYALLESVPPAVELRLSDALSPASEIEVQSTITVLPSGEREATGGVNVTRSSGLDPRDAERRTLRAELEPGVPGGLFVVRWTAVAAHGGARRFGSYYFGVGMAVPEHIRDEWAGRIYERDYWWRGTRSALAGGVILVLLGIFLPALARRSTLGP
jgi:methionine-rich copper-binding protein CopC